MKTLANPNFELARRLRLLAGDARSLLEEAATCIEALDMTVDQLRKEARRQEGAKRKLVART